MIRVWLVYFKRQMIAFGCGLLTAALSSGFAHAQDFRGAAYDTLDRTQTVIERPHPDYETRGLHHGSFVLKPSVTTDLLYTDNIFATQNNVSDDWVTVINPNLRVQSLPSTRHDLLLDLSAKQSLHASNTSENTTDYSAHLAPRLYASQSLWFDGGLTFEHTHEDRTSPNVIQTLAEPLEYDRYAAQLSATYKPGLMALTLGGMWEGYQFDNTAQLGGGQVIQNDRDRHEYRVHGELAYEFKPRYEAFLRATVNTIDYERNEFVAGPDTYTGNNRDSKGYDVLAGVRFDLTSIMRADLGVGYLSQNYDQAGLSDINGLNLHSDIAWNVTPLTTVNFGLDRFVKESVSNGASGYLETSASMRLDHELRRNIILSTGADLAVQDYKGTSQKDDVQRFNARATYKMNRNVNWILDYLYDQRDSNAAGFDYDRNIIMLRAKFKL